MEVGDLITLYRKQAGMTIEELADKSGVPKGTLTKIIGGVTKAPTLQNMKAIARTLGKTLADFDDLPIQSKEKTPSDAITSPEGDREAILSKLFPALVSAGLIEEGHDLTDAQTDTLIGLYHIIRGAFNKGN